MKKVAIIGTAGVPGRYGGFETLAHNLVIQLGKEFEFTVYNSKKLYEKEERTSHWRGAKIVYLPLSANGISSIIYDILSMIHALFFADILLILGVSGGIFLPIIRLLTNKKIVVNIDGLEWRREKWNKYVRKFLHFSEIMAVKASHAVITDNAAIQRYVGLYYGTISYLIAYGADHVNKEKLDMETVYQYPFLKYPYAFSVARIEPENKVHLILEAFAKTTDRQLVFVGNWNHSQYGIKLKSKYGRYTNIHMLDAIYDQKLLDSIRSNCQVYIHGHSAGGTNPSLVEAMYLSLPVFAFDVNFNRATTYNKANFFSASDELVALLKNTTQQELKRCGNEMYQIALLRYTWYKVSMGYRNIFLAFDYHYVKKNIGGWLSLLPESVLQKENIGHLKWQKNYFDF